MAAEHALPAQATTRHRSIRMRLVSSFMVVFLAIAGYGLFISGETQTMHARLLVARERNDEYTLLWNLKYANRQLVGKTRAVVYAKGDHTALMTGYDEGNAAYDDYGRRLVTLFDDQESLARLQELRAAGDRLRSSEQQLFALEEAGRHDEALALLAGPYQDGLFAYSDRIDRFLQTQSEAIESGVQTLRQQALAINSASLVVLMLILVLILLVFVLINRNIIQPIQALAAVARAFSDGDLSVRGTVGAHDELGELTATFNAMGERLESRTKELVASKETLEDDVKRRTAELEEKIAELERFNRFVVGRELKMVELKKQLAALKKQGKA